MPHYKKRQNAWCIFQQYQQHKDYVQIYLKRFLSFKQEEAGKTESITHPHSLHCSLNAKTSRYNTWNTTQSLDRSLGVSVQWEGHTKTNTLQKYACPMATHQMEVLDSEVLIICETKHHNDEYISKQCQADTGPTIIIVVLDAGDKMCYSTESLVWLQWVWVELKMATCQHPNLHNADALQHIP